MNSRVSWSVDGIDPSVRERAEAAARRAGMSLNDWLNSTFGEPAPPEFPQPLRSAPGDAGQETPRRRRHSSAAGSSPGRSSRFRGQRRAARPRARRSAAREPGVARQLNDAISRLDARLSQISNPAPVRQAQMQDKQRQTEMVERAAARSIAPRPRSARPRSTLRSPKSPRARTNSTVRAAADAPRSRRPGARWRRREAPRSAGGAGRPGLFVAGTPSAQDHQPDRGAAAPRWRRTIDRRIPHRTRRDPPRHHRGDAAPGDRIDRERNPLAVPPHRRHQPERQRRPGARRHRTRARRNPRSAALADAGRTTGRLRRCDPQSRRQARSDPALERRSVDGAAA